MRGIFLLTPQHTGTHYTRMLLESHPAIGWCIQEDRKVDGVRLDSLFFAGLAGEVDFDCVLARFEEANGRRLEDARRREFGEWGVPVPAKGGCRRLFHAHLKQTFRGQDLAGLQIVVSVRHPLLAVITALRRGSNLDDLFFALEYGFRIKAVRVAVDLPADRLAIFNALQLEPAETTRAFLARAPIINRTLCQGEPHPTHNYSVAEQDNPELLSARRMLVEERRIHPLLRPYWARLQREQMLDPFSQLGYDFADLKPAGK
jgi:hypothetical protein